MSLDLLTIMLVPVGLLLVVLTFITLNRYITYKERVALAQLGFSLEDLSRVTSFRRHGNRGVLWGGVITAMSGLGLTMGLATIGTGAWLLGGFLPLFVGLGMVIIYFMTMGQPPTAEGRQAARVSLEERDVVDLPLEATAAPGSREQGDQLAPNGASGVKS